jgi:hypothetical protein
MGDRRCREEGTLMPVKIETFEPFSDEEFDRLRQQKTRTTDPAMVALLAEVDAGQPVRVPLVQGQSARGLEGQRRRGRPPKRQEEDAAEIASLEDLAYGES